MERRQRVTDGRIITVYMDDELANRALEIAHAQDMSRCALIRKLLREYLEKETEND